MVSHHELAILYITTTSPSTSTAHGSRASRREGFVWQHGVEFPDKLLKIPCSFSKFLHQLNNWNGKV